MNLWVESTVQDSTHVLAQVRAHLDEFVATAKFGAYEFLTARQVVHGERKTGSKPAINLTKFRGFRSRVAKMHDWAQILNCALLGILPSAM
jgi:hypothetical protein